MKFAAVLFCVLLLSPALSFASPEISFETTEHDFGALAPDENARHTFDFTNTGDEELLIKNIAAP